MLSKKIRMSSIDQNPFFSKRNGKETVHHLLKYGRRVTETKEHNSRFKESKLCLEYYFPLITFLDSDIIVAPINIKFCKVLGPFEIIKEI